MWQIETTTQWERDQKHYQKKHPDALAAILRNLERFLSLLNLSKNSKCVMAGFLHHEPHGVVAVDQKGFRGNVPETRLYTLPVDKTQTLYLITIGDKNSQHSDVEFSRRFAGSFDKA